MKALRALRFIAIGLGLAYALPTACGNSGVVGGECRRGTDCRSDSASGGANSKGGSSTSGNGGNAQGNAGDGVGADANQGGTGDLTDGGFFDSPIDGLSDADVPPLECLPPFDSPAHCGSCENECVDPEPLCAPDPTGEVSFTCVPVCEPPLVECRGQCVDPATAYKSDPDNCGRCGNECPSEICQDGKCVGARYGNVAVLCMDFNSSGGNSPSTTLLGNAIFTATANPVRVLAYTRGAGSAAVTRVNQLIGGAGGVRNRSVQFTEAKTVAAVTANLSINDYQVLLIHDLDEAEPGDAAAAATTWESAGVLSSFAKAGGVIVVLDGGDGTGEMHELINAGRLLDPAGSTVITGQTDITNQQVWNNAPFDVLGANVLSPFLATSHSCTFDTTLQPSADTIFVLTDDEAGGEPVAIHRVIAP